MKKFANQIFAVMLALSLVACVSGCRSSNPDDEYSIISEIVLVEDGGNNGNTDNNDADGNNSAAGNNSTGNQGTGNSNSSKNNNSGGSTGNSTDASSLKGTTITFATWEGITSDSYKGKLISAFTKKTGIKVKLLDIDQNSYITKLTGYKAAGTAPDVVISNQQFPRVLPLLQPLSNVGINANDSKFSQTITKHGTVNGKQYLVGSAVDGNYFVCFYNKNVFDQVGVPTPDKLIEANNWTLDTFREVAVKIHQYNSEWTGAALAPTAFPATYGGGYIQYDPAASKFVNTTGSTAFNEIWRYILTGVKADYFYPRFDIAGVIKGTTGMTCVDTYGLMTDGYFKQMKSSEIGVTYMPKKNASDSEYPVGALIFGYGVAEGAKNPEGAAAFLNYYLDPANISSDNKFINTQAEELYNQLIKRDIPLENILVAKGVATITIKAVDLWDNEIIACDPAQLSVGVSKINNQVNVAVNKANEIIASKK